jgi:branched-chain amino acid transport system permease protein
MDQFISLTVAGIATYGCVYALTAMGLVVTYTTSGIFNFAQGAIGMICAFFYFELNQVWHWPSPVALIFTVLVFAPAIGALLERVVIRRLEGARLEAKLTVTIALTLVGIGLATAFWNPQQVRSIPQFFNGDQVGVGGVNLTYQQLFVVGAAVAAAILLKVFFAYTRSGIATRAVVDDRELASLTGAAPTRFSQLGWAMGCGLAALAGILIAPSNGALDVNNLTLLVITGYAAAMVGRLRSLPMTFLGGILLGLLVSYAVGYLPGTPGWGAVGNITPMLFLLLVLLVMPQSRAVLSSHIQVRAPRIVGLRESVIAGGGLIIVGVVFSQLLNGTALGYANKGLALGIIMLSLVLLTGYGGQVSLCQMSFAGLGAYAMSKVGGDHGSLLGLLAAMGLAGAVGAVLALPALRLRGLYLALATFAFAQGMDIAFFNQLRFFGAAQSIPVARPNVFGWSLESDRSLLVALAVLFAIVAVGLSAIRRSRFGRRLLAMSDSPGACMTLGVDMTQPKLAVFTVSAAIAGLGGAMYGGVQTQVGPNDFQFLLSLTLLLLVVIWGIRTTAGMVFAGVAMALGPLLELHWTHPRDIFEILIGGAVIGISQNPEGTFGGNTPLQKWRDSRSGRAPTAAAGVLGGTDGRLTHA